MSHTMWIMTVLNQMSDEGSQAPDDNESNASGLEQHDSENSEVHQDNEGNQSEHDSEDNVRDTQSHAKAHGSLVSKPSKTQEMVKLKNDQVVSFKMNDESNSREAIVLRRAGKGNTCMKNW